MGKNLPTVKNAAAPVKFSKAQRKLIDAAAAKKAAKMVKEVRVNAAHAAWATRREQKGFISQAVRMLVWGVETYRNRWTVSKAEYLAVRMLETCQHANRAPIGARAAKILRKFKGDKNAALAAMRTVESEFCGKASKIQCAAESRVNSDGSER